MSSHAGAQLTATPTTDVDGFGLGQTITQPGGAVYMYVHAGGVIAQYDWVAIDEDFEAVAGTKALADAGHRPGFAQVAFADNDYGYVLIRGDGGNVNVLADCAADVQLYTTATAGKLDDTSTSQTPIYGCRITTLAGGSTQAEECILGHVVFGTPG